MYESDRGILNPPPMKRTTHTDDFHGRVLTPCIKQLGCFLSRNFQLLITKQFISNNWKSSNIIHVSKLPSAKLKKEFRPEVLTSVL